MQTPEKERKFTYQEAKTIAERVKSMLAPHCIKIEIAGSIRRKKAMVGDIEIVAIPKPYHVGLFKKGLPEVVDQWPKVRGELPCRYTQRTLPEGIKLDLFMCEADNWGYIYAIRTGSAEYSKKMAENWVKRGYKGINGKLTKKGVTIPVRDEMKLFHLIGMEYVAPEFRNV